MGMVISGLTADARIICKFMRDACINYQYMFGTKHPAERLIAQVSKKAAAKTMHYAKRPYGVGLLVGSVDKAGTHLFETCPSGNYFESTAMAIGDKNQSAKTYLEGQFESFRQLGAGELVKHGLKALRASAQETELTEQNVSVGVIGVGEDFRQLSRDEIREALAGLDGDEQMIVN